MSRNTTPMELAIVVGILGIGGSIFGCKEVVNTVNYVSNRYTVEGEVTAEPRSKFRASGNAEQGMAATEKFSVALDTSTGPKIINCSNTQCASLQVGQVAQFSCFEQWHYFTPNEEECRFVKLLPAGK